MKPTIIQEIQDERRRQISKEGWTPTHDDEHNNGELALAAACYAASAGGVHVDALWPWGEAWDKRGHHSNRRQLVIAAALIVAEIERIDRLEGACEWQVLHKDEHGGDWSNAALVHASNPHEAALIYTEEWDDEEGWIANNDGSIYVEVRRFGDDEITGWYVEANRTERYRARQTEVPSAHAQ